MSNKSLKGWFSKKPKNKVELSVEVGGFIVEFKTYTLDITTISGNFSVSFTASEHPYLYLYAAAKGGHDDQIHGYCLFLYKMATCLTTDQGLVDDIAKALKKYDKRLLKAAKEAAKKASKIEDDMALESVKRTIAYSEMSEEERNKASEDFIKQAREMLNGE